MGVKGGGCDPFVDCPLSSPEVLRRTITNVRIGDTLFWIAPLVWESEMLLYRFETWSVTLRDEYRPRVFQNRVLRKIFRHKSDEVTGQWGRLQ
jgi:hypothetical protein